MKFSQSLIKTRKEKVKEADSINADLLIRASYIDQLSAGVYSFLPLGLKVIDNINQIIREEMNAIGGRELLLPALHRAELWKKTERYDTAISFKTKSQVDQEYVLGWTHEEVITPLAKKFITSYRDLPLYLYQIQLKFRDELRAKSGLLRTREFLMKDLYSFHSSEKDLEDYYEKVKKAYLKIFDRCGLGKKTYYTYATGGDFSPFSNEFQVLSESGEDIIFICEKCQMAVNKEIIRKQKDCPKCGNKNLKEARAIEAGNIFKLGTKFSRAFGLNYLDKKDRQQLVHMGCYGLGPARLMGAIVEIYHDDKGIIWPKTVAPYKIHLISLGEKSAVRKEAQRVYDKFLENQISIIWDDRDETAGAKFADADLLGMPVRLVASQKTVKKDSIELKLRQQKETKLIKIKDLLEQANKVLGK
jgi:prolyl-tRNA synthetase